MKSGLSLSWSVCALLALGAAGCSSSSSGGGGVIAVTSAVQDLTSDPLGRTTLVSFSAAPTGITAANFESSGGQLPQTAVVTGNTVTVVWDESLGTSDQIRIVGLPGFATAFSGVSSTDMTTPTILAVSGTQNPGLGGDEITVEFAGVAVDASTAEDFAHWTLEVNGNTLDLSGSTFDFDEGTQELTITLGSTANLHANFELTPSGVTSVADVALPSSTQNGAANGDAAAPTLLDVTQRLDLDEFGRILDFTFSEALDPLAAPLLVNFGVTLPDAPTAVQQILPAGEVLRVTFNAPQVPGLDQIDLNDLIDAHGNAFPDGPQPVTATEPLGGVVNAFDLTPGEEPLAEAVADAGGDFITFQTTQAFDPATVTDPANWSVVVDGNPVLPAEQTITYDFLAKSVRIDLDIDMPQGAPFSITGVSVVDVDGAAFTATHVGVVSGDATPPAVTGAVQNRTQDGTGATVDVTFGEDVEETTAENVANWSATGGLTVLTAERLNGFNVVRLVLDGAAVPGVVTLGVQNVADLAGNVMPAPQLSIAITTTDATAPVPLTAEANAVEGALNDTVVVLFSDDMFAADLADPLNWIVESPPGNAIDTTGASASYDAGSRRATLDLDAILGQDFQTGDTFSVRFVNARDLGGNVVGNVTLTNNVSAEANLPAVESIWRVGAPNDEVTVVFSEPCAQLDDLFAPVTNADGTRYVLRDDMGAVKANAADAVVLDQGLAVRVGFSVPVLATDTVDVFGVVDLAGNELFPQLAEATVAADSSVPSLATGFSTLAPISGERNDLITVTFDVPMHSFELLRPSNFTFNPPLNLNQATLTMTSPTTVQIALDGTAADNLLEGQAYDLSVVNVRSAQGVARTVTDTEVAIVGSGDAVAPDVLAGSLRIDPLNVESLIYESTEAITVLSAFVYANFQYQGSVAAIQAEVLTPRTVRIHFSTGTNVTVGQTVDLTFLDAAGNSTGLITRAITAADAAEPVINSVSAVATPGRGGDYLEITWDESLDLSTALDLGNYAVQNGAAAVSLTGAEATYDSVTRTVRIALSSFVDLDNTANVTFTIVNVADVSGNALSGPATPSVAVSGDVTAPGVANAFANLRRDPTGRTIEVLFDEDVDMSHAADSAFWSTSGAATVTSATAIGLDRVRLNLSQALTSGQNVILATGLEDFAGNVQGNAGALTIAPVL